MALIKSQHAADLTHDAIVLDLGDLRRQAAAIVEKAQQQADRILADARAEAARLTASAHQQGYDAGFAQGRAAGFDVGQKDGHAAALQHSSANLQQIQQAFIDAAGAWDAQRQQMLLDARQSLLELAFELARKIVHRIPAVDPSVVVDQAAAAIRHVARPCDLALVIHPKDRPLIEQAMPQLVAALQQTQHVALLDDLAIQRGGCVVRFGRGRVDATLRTQLDRLAATLLPDHDGEPAGEVQPA